MSLKRPLYPKFLANAEHKFLLKKPETWSARAHLVVYYGLMFIVLLAAVSFLVPDDPRTRSKSEMWLLFVSIISILSLTIWLIYLLRFNVFKRFGITSAKQRLFTFLLYFASAGTIVLFNFVQPAVESVRANMAYGDEEIVNDINTINTNLTRISYDSLQHFWNDDTILIVEAERAAAYQRRSYEYVEPSTDTIELVPKPPYILVDTSEFRTEYGKSDSLVKLNDSMYVNFTCPEYTFLDSYIANSNLNEDILSSAQIYRKYLQPYQRPSNIPALRKEVTDLVKKYTIVVEQLSYYSESDYDDEKSIEGRIRKRYNLSAVSFSIGHIVERKFKWSEQWWPIYIRLFYYFTIFITLLVFILRHTTVKTFFWSLLTLLVLSILTGLLMAFFRYTDVSFFGVVLFYSLVAFFLSLLIWRNRTRTVYAGISLNLVVLIIPLIPMMILMWYYSLIGISSYAFDADPEAVQRRARLFLMSEFAGPALLLVLLITYIHSGYRKWYSLPAE